MSRIGKKPVTVPKGVTLELQGHTVAVKGPQGRAPPRRLHPDMRLAAGRRRVHRRAAQRGEAAQGAARAHPHPGARTWWTGVSKGFSKTLEIQGVGYKAEAKPYGVNLIVGLLAPGQVRGAEGHQDLGREQHDGEDRGRRQGDRGPGGRRAPLGAPARAVQGQGHPLPGRAGPPQGRQDRSQVSHAHDSRARRPRRSCATAATSGSAGRWPARRSGRGWWCSARSSTSTPSSSTTTSV